MYPTKILAEGNFADMESHLIEFVVSAQMPRNISFLEPFQVVQAFGQPEGARYVDHLDGRVVAPQALHVRLLRLRQLRRGRT